MTSAQKAALKRELQSAIAQTAGEIAQLAPQLEPIASDCCLGDLTRVELMGEQQIYAKAYDAATRRLNRLEYALSRIDRDTFGICEACEEPIAAARLGLMPEATLCIDCANEKGR
jgi:DnaK suppressor protein